LLAKNQNLPNQLDSLKDTNSRLIDYVKSINKKVGTGNSEKEFSEITENYKSRKIKDFKSKAIFLALMKPDMFVVAHHKILSVPYKRSR
jgi:hypothetical protein